MNAHVCEVRSLFHKLFFNNWYKCSKVVRQTYGQTSSLRKPGRYPPVATRISLGKQFLTKTSGNNFVT